MIDNTTFGTRTAVFHTLGCKLNFAETSTIGRQLTEKQKACVVAYYLEGRKMIDIAQDLGVAPSTVTRHIQSGKNRLMNIAKYYM